MIANPRVPFFDELAERWDGFEDLEVLEQKLAAGLEALGVGPDEVVLDVGCGTGNLVQALLRKLSAKGRVVAVDISARMLEVAGSKVRDERVSWHLEDARQLPLADGSCDRIFCYSVWPHFEDRLSIAKELRRILVAGGSLHVWHLLSREAINEIHAKVDEAVRHDVLAPVEETAALLEAAGFEIAVAKESDEDYLVTAVKQREGA